MRTIQRAAFAAAAILIPAAAGAQQITSPYRFVETRQSAELYVGNHWSDRGSLELGPEGGLAIGARYTILLSSAYVIEADLAYLPSQRYVFGVDSTAQAPTMTRVGETDLSLLSGQIGLRLNLTGPRTWHDLQPFIILGGGVVVDLTGDVDANRLVASDAVFDFGTSFAGQFGAGVEWYVQRRLGLRLDVRDVLWKVETPIAFAAERVPASEWVQSPMLSIGAAFHF